MSNQLATIWEREQRRKDKRGYVYYEWEHNHLEEAWVESNKPTIKCPEQKEDWHNPEVRWRQIPGYLIGNNRFVTIKEYTEILIHGE